MCGIAGWVNLKENIENEYPVVINMADKLSNRGPDAEGLWTSSHALFSHRRLIVVDPAGGSQPMTRQYGDREYVITYNGELYNTKDLRDELEARGHSFRSTSDTEVLLVSYIEWGPDCVEHLNGIFAFGIWDEYNQRLFLGRDRFGVKPLFYSRYKDSLIFASELKALLVHPFIIPEVDSEGLAEVFALGPSRTPGHGVIKNVHEVRPAYCILFDVYGLHTKKYWSLESLPHTDNLDETTEKVRFLVEDTIERQLISDVPVCTFLSGGLDSSAITAIASNYFNKTGRGQLDTFSIDYVDNDKYFKSSSFQPTPDAPWVKRMTEETGTRHHNVYIDSPQLANALDHALKARDLPGMADIDSSLWYFCREVKNLSTVALSGECADEVFGGYPWFHREELLNANTFPWAYSLRERTKVLSKDLKAAIRAEEYVASRYEETLKDVPRLEGEDPAEARRREMFYLNITWFMATLLDRKDRMSMASGLEVRVPFCDHRLVQYVWNIPWEMKMHDGREKGILRRALNGILPEDVIERRKSPYPKTHNPSYEGIVRNRILGILNDNSSPLHPLVDSKEIIKMTNATSDYGKPWFGQLMATPQMYAYLIQVDMWLREYGIRIV